MRRRDFMMLVGGSVVVSPLTARAQQVGKMPKVGVLWHAASAEEEAVYLGALRQGLSAKPANIPVEQPTTFEFLINRKTAKALGITIADTVLARADGVLD